jgi:uncharacterized protein (TIRG00374 family)
VADNGHQSHPLTWKTVVKRAIAVAVAGLGIYLVLPSLTRVLASWPRLSTLNPVWFAVAVGAEVASFACTFALQRVAFGTRRWFAVVTSGLSGNAISRIFPGGAAAGAAVQYRMLSTAGVDSGTAVGGLTALSVLGVASLLALPIFALPAILFGAPVSAGLINAALIGMAGFVLLAGVGIIVLTTDGPLTIAGRAVERVWKRIFRHRPPLTGLDKRLLHGRDQIRSVLGRNWKRAVVLSAGRLGFDYLCLLAALRATGSDPRPSLVLLAYAVAGVVGLLPITPGGLGIVEASLSGLLILAGVGPGDAFLATLAYRLASYWLPLLAGPVAYLMFRRRFDSSDSRSGPVPSE